MKTGAMRQVQKEMKVLTVTEISTMVPASAILPITVKTGNNALGKRRPLTEGLQQ